jgi:hypothetical protein
VENWKIPTDGGMSKNLFTLGFILLIEFFFALMKPIKRAIKDRRKKIVIELKRQGFNLKVCMQKKNFSKI